jgi:predicted ATPase/DNA-binding winged helix-turn-helix (wHTH) protein
VKQAQPTTQQFGPIEIRPAERQLRIDGQPVRLGVRAFDVLLALIERRDRAVSKNELLEIVWPGRVVEDNNLQVHVWALRKLLGPAIIATVPGQGYRFVPPAPGDLPSEHQSVAGIESGALPPPPTLFGRDDCLLSLCSLVAVHRAVSLVGASGIGKSALAHALAHAMKGEFAAGVGLVDLATLRNGEHLALAVSSGLLMAPRAQTTAALAERLRHGRCLIVLDNCEPVLPAVAEFAAALLRASPQLHLLMTGHEALRLPDEQVYRLGALTLPPPAPALTPEQARAAGAVQLFEQRVRAVDRSFELNSDNVDAVLDICRRLDGVALALELAAARVPLLGLDGLRTRLEESMRMLAGGALNAPARQRTVQAALAWSYGLLSLRQQAVLRRLSVAVGGFDVAAAQSLAADATLDEWQVLDELAPLAEKSLVIAERTPGGALRYRLLQPVRQFAMNELVACGEFDATRERHLAFFLAQAERAGQGLEVPGRGHALMRLSLEGGNLTAALDACDHAPQGAECGLRLVCALSRYWVHHGMIDQGYRAAMHALARPGTQALANLRARVLLQAGWLCAERGSRLDALRHLQDGVEIARACDAPELLCEGLARLADAHLALHDHAAARACIDEASALLRPLTSPSVTLLALTVRANIEGQAGRLSASRALYDEALRHARAAGDPLQVMATLNRLAALALAAGAATHVPAWLRECVAICNEFGSLRGFINLMRNCAALAASRAQWEHAARFAGAAEAQSRQLARQGDLREKAAHDALRERIQSALGSAGYEAARLAGQALDHDNAIHQLQIWLQDP